MRLVFDRGTILAVAPPPDLPLAAIPGVRLDPGAALAALGDAGGRPAA